MKVLVLLALLGFATALQYPVELEYEYEARVGTGVQSTRPQFAATGIKAKVVVTMTQDGQGSIKVSNTQVGDKNQVVGNNGRDDMKIPYSPIQDKSIEQPFNVHFRQRNGQTVMEVPQNDQLWVTNLRKGIANFFRIAPIIEPSSVQPGPSNGVVEPQGFTRFEDTFAGHCAVEYTFAPASIYHQKPRPSEDIQSPDSPKGPGGRAVKIEDQQYRVVSSLDFSTCADRVALMQTGAANLTNITSTSFRDVSTRSQIGTYILRGSPGKLRVEAGQQESIFISNPYGIETDKMVVVSNQTMRLMGARPLAGGVHSQQAKASGQSLQPIKTWSMQFQSPNAPPTSEAPKQWVKYVKDNGSEPSPVYFDRIVSGFGLTDGQQDKTVADVIALLDKITQQAKMQNKDHKEAPKDYVGSHDGFMAQQMYQVVRLIRTLRVEKIRQLDQPAHRDIQDPVRQDLLNQALGVAGSGPSLTYLFEKIQQGQITDNRTSSIFFSLANNIQSPEAIEHMMKFVMSIEEEQRVSLSLFTKINFSILARRLCISSQLARYSHMRAIYGNKICKRDQLISQYLPSLQQKIESSSKIWVKILNVIAAAELGAQESLPILEKVARGGCGSDKFLRYAAIHGMSALSFDNTSRHQIFNILQPIAESQSEDYRVRQIAYNSLLAWHPNATFLQRMAASSSFETSQQMKSYIYWVMSSISQMDDPLYRQQSSVARNLLPLTEYVNPTMYRSSDSITARYLPKEFIGSTGEVGWTTQYKNSFPSDMYGFVSGQYGGMRIPLVESGSFVNTQALYAKMRNVVDMATKFQKPSSYDQKSGQQQSYDQQTLNSRQSKIHQKIQSMRNHSSRSFSASGGDQKADIYQYARLFRTSEIFLPLTNELYSDVERNVQRALHSMSEGEAHDLRYTKFFNPVEIDVIMPTPAGLHYHVETATPTIIHLDVRVQAKLAPKIKEANELPKLERIEVTAEGIGKVVTKANTYTYILAPWSNRTMMSGIDNEKSASLPMKYEIHSTLRMPAQEIWAIITPKFVDAPENIPLIKIRNVPFTSIAGVTPSSTDETADLKQVEWIPERDRRVRVVYPISKQLTGLDAEVRYEGEPQAPLDQPNFINYLIMEPSRLVGLLASPSIKNYDLTFYQNKQPSDTKNIGISLRHLVQQGEQSAPAIVSPAAAGQPIDTSSDDTIQQREQKLRKFSNKLNHQYSVRVNFTGSQEKEYEASFTYAEDEKLIQQRGADPLVHKASKAQITLLEKNQESQDRKNKTCIVGVIDRPQIRPTADVSSLLSQHKLDAPVGINLYEGDACSAGQPIPIKAEAKLTVSEDRVQEMRNVTVEGHHSFQSNETFARLAVYDRLTADASWQDNLSPQVQNASYRLQDLLEGYLFPKILKNNLAKNGERKLHVEAQRNLADDRTNAFINLPTADVRAQRIVMSRWFDAATGFSTDVYLSDIGTPSRVSASSASDRCLVQPSQVKTFDGVTYQKLDSTCQTLALEIQQSDDNIVVSTRKMEQSLSQAQEVHILSTKGPVDVKISDRHVEIDGQVMSPQQAIKEVKDNAGNVLAKVTNSSNMIVVEMPGKLEVTIKDKKQLIIRLDQRFKTAAKGLCGDYNSEATDDLRDPTSCVYTSSEGPMYAASWVSQENDCQDPQMKTLSDQVRQHQQGCSKGKRAIFSENQCTIEAYPVTRQGVQICLITEKQKICKSQCKASNKQQKSVRSKCWSTSTAPREVIMSINRGYITHDVSDKGDVERTLMLSVPETCEPQQLSRRAGSECQVIGYAVREERDQLCVTERSLMVCSQGCSNVDSIPVQMNVNCWPADQAPPAVQSSKYQGFVTSAVHDKPQSKRQMMIQQPRSCSPGAEINRLSSSRSQVSGSFNSKMQQQQQWSPQQQFQQHRQQLSRQQQQGDMNLQDSYANTRF